jgi:hypothetical protein
MAWLMLILFASGFTSSKAKTKVKTVENQVLIYATSELNGYLEPCGCFIPQIGGFLRRAGYLSTVKSPSIRFDNGDLTEASGRQDEIKAETIISFFDLLQYRAVNLGEQDFKLGLTYLQSLQSAFKGKLLSSNVLGADGKPVFNAYTTFNQTLGGKKTKFAVVGALSPLYATIVTDRNPELTVAEIAPILMKLKAEIKADFVILLYHGPKEESVELAKRFPWISVIVYAHASDSPSEPTKTGNTLLIQPGQKGKYLGELTLAINKTGKPAITKTREVVLGPEIKGNKAANAIRLMYLSRINDENLLLSYPKMPSPEGLAYVGNETCKDCHSTPYQAWAKSKHARAFRTLEEVKHEADPECVICHVVGFEYTKGFINLEKTPQLKNVGCESCHGPASNHINQDAPMPEIDSASCDKCHVSDHSPNFDFKTYWEKIKH